MLTKRLTKMSMRNPLTMQWDPIWRKEKRIEKKYASEKKTGNK